MKVTITFIFLLTLSTLCAQRFESQQKRYSRVRQAYQEKEQIVDSLFREKGITAPEIVIRAFKKEMTFEIWAKDATDTSYQPLMVYDFCSTSGVLGPKRRQGDMQIPEGFYHINHFNPYSNFYLSLGINYPNASDKILGVQENLGGNIYLHGACVTIGCIPLTDDKIKEVYVMAVKAKNAGQQQIPVMIFPAEMNTLAWGLLQATYAENPALIAFWENLKAGYDYFEKYKRIPTFSVSKEGKYQFK